MSDLRCDNYATCGERIMDRGDSNQTLMKAIAASWTQYVGFTQDGRELVVVLGPACRRARPRELPPAPPHLPQPDLFEENL